MYNVYIYLIYLSIMYIYLIYLCIIFNFSRIEGKAVSIYFIYFSRIEGKAVSIYLSIYLVLLLMTELVSVMIVPGYGDKLFKQI